ncbi:hypothetical protein BPA01_16220 [Brevibacillus parabrevis]|uniref:Uncharacterized protein n=1 Tax=Brevibacillus parabrevis TaxID=54914 RepID=A0A4Y3PCB3_BREPA|nr:hypothetical protein BPA01_16220 [Brevibacillus parabrevis]
MFNMYLDNEQFNLQINRFIQDYYEEDERASSDLQTIVPRLTDAETGGEQHCQAGACHLAFDEMKKFL